MSINRYYKVMGLTPNATDQEVRKRYRMLAMRYHPDKNGSAEAAEKFILLTEAYEIILGKKQAPNQAIERRGSTTKTAEERKKEAKKRYTDKIKKEMEENERFFQNMIKGKKWNLIRFFSVVGIALSFLLILDIFLPPHYEKDRVEFYSRDVFSGMNNRDISLLRTENKNDVWVDGLNFSLYGLYPDIYIQRSRIFHDPVNVISIQKVEFTYYPVHYTFHSVSYIAILIFLLPAFTRWYKRRTIFFTVLWNLSLYLTGITIVVFLLANDHWAHLITLGFL